ncbi:MAG: hypothetical protein F6J93_09790 [Oscillatoria sp. SIO1A7]|nr:hypothetical protein [Oscillatoria sp. SIO1A7]
MNENERKRRGDSNKSNYLLAPKGNLPFWDASPQKPQINLRTTISSDRWFQRANAICPPWAGYALLGKAKPTPTPLPQNRFQARKMLFDFF